MVIQEDAEIFCYLVISRLVRMSYHATFFLTSILLGTPYLFGQMGESVQIVGSGPSVKENVGDRIEELKAKIKKTPRNLRLVIELAQEFYNQNDPEKTLLLLWKQVDRIDRDALLLLVKAHEKRQEFDKIIKVSQIMITRNPKDAEAYKIQGSAYLSQRKTISGPETKKKEALALDSLKRSIEIDSHYEPAYLEVAKIYDKKEKPNLYELRLLYQDMVEKIGGKPEYYAKLCEINYKDGVNDAAILACTKAIELDPQSISSQVILGQVHYQMGGTEKGLLTLKAATEKFPLAVAPHEAYAKALDDQKNFVESFKAYEKCLQIKNDHEACLIGASLAGVQIQKNEQGLKYGKEACILNKKHAAILRKIASQLKNSKDELWSSEFDKAASKCLQK